MAAILDRDTLHQPIVIGFLLALLIVTTLIYYPGLSGPFLFDDAPNITDNTFLTHKKESLLDWWAAAQSSGAGALRRPIPMFSFALQLPDGPPDSGFALKAVNLFVHLLCGCLVFVLAKRLGAAVSSTVSPIGTRVFPILAAALWLLNPLQVSTVLYPVQRMAQFAALFSLAGLVVYAGLRQRWAERGARLDECIALMLWLLLFSLLAVLSKENGILLPWLVASLEVTIFRGRWNGSYSARIRALGVGSFLLPLLAATLLVWWQWDWVVRGYAYREFDVAQRLWTESRLLWAYVGWFVLPRLGELGLFHDGFVVSTSWLDPPSTLFSVLAWCTAILLGLLTRRSFPWLLMGVVFYLVAHSIESSFLALELVFEHRNYLPSVGLALLLAAGLAQSIALAGAHGKRLLGWLPSLALLLLLCVSTLARAVSWSSELGLASDSFARHPESARSAHFYANTLLKLRSTGLGDPQRAAEYLTVARHEFEALHQRDPLDLSALVMLYTMDSSYFSAIADTQQWVAGIESSLRESRLGATEYAAMRVLVACTLDGACALGRTRLTQMVDTFAQRYAYSHGSAQLVLRIEEHADVTVQQRIETLEAALARSPGEASLYYPLIGAWIEAGNYAAAHQVILRFLSVDSSRRHLPLIDALFRGEDENPSG